jgi:hypothetical protein
MSTLYPLLFPSDPMIYDASSSFPPCERLFPVPGCGKDSPVAVRWQNSLPTSSARHHSHRSSALLTHLFFPVLYLSGIAVSKPEKMIPSFPTKHALYFELDVGDSSEERG